LQHIENELHKQTTKIEALISSVDALTLTMSGGGDKKMEASP
jgi:hypothetical protein